MTYETLLAIFLLMVFVVGVMFVAIFLGWLKNVISEAVHHRDVKRKLFEYFKNL